MKFFQISSDGGKDSGVKGLFIVEIKSLFSIVLLRFSNGTREAYHSHAFNAWTWFLKGRVEEQRLDCFSNKITIKEFGPSLKPKYTPRNNCHRVNSLGVAWALSFRGPWSSTWLEYRESKGFVTLTSGRIEVP